MRFKGTISYSRKVTRKNLFNNISFYINKCRSISGLSAWSEELTPSTKRSIEDFWTNRISFTKHDDSKEKFYVLSMFPYPSGQLHMGHVRVYTISDVMARFYRMNGKNVIHPMGWDAFGLPAENAARDHCVEPADWTIKNIQRMKNQLIKLGCSFDWECEVSTCDPLYYRWTQSIFLKLYSKGLIYQKKALVNWDPVDETVLADEQVDHNGCSWRSGAVVEKKWLKQWFVKTTKFAKLLLDGLDDPRLEDWRDIINLQRHWIGSCHGSTFEFRLVNEDGIDIHSDKILNVWTENPELLYGVGFIAISPEHSISLMLGGNDKVTENCTNGVSWTRLPFLAIHPFTKERLPVIIIHPLKGKDSKGLTKTISHFKEGMDCRFGFPGENDIDYKIAIAGNFPLKTKMVDEENNKMLPHSGPLAGLNIENARLFVLDKARQMNVGGYSVSPRLQDWLISRQRYWGTPIPMVHCKKCGAVPVREKDLPVTLPPAEINKQEGGFKALTLEKNENWKQTSCPSCGMKAERETDTMDTFVDSSWYYLRYLDSKNKNVPFSIEKAEKLMPVDLYIGGKEHAVLHLYYARFMSYFFHSEGLLPQPEPFKRLLVQGMVMGKTYKSKESGKYLRSDEVVINGKKAIEKTTGKPVAVSWEKMSKSKYNGVEPSDMFDEHGVDTTRLLVLADVAPTSHRNWSPETFPGIINWQKRLWLTIRQFRDLRTKDTMLPLSDKFKEEEEKLWDARNFYLKGASFNYKISYQLSIAISKMQGLTNSLRKASPSVIQQGKEFERALATQLILLAPMAPHFASELWSGFVNVPGRVNCDSDEIDWEKGVLDQKWPEVDDNYLLELVCKLNGSERCRFKIPCKELVTLKYEEALEMCLSHPSFGKLSRIPYHSATGDEKKRCIVDTTFMLYPGYQASINVVTESGAGKAEDKVQKGSKEDFIEKDAVSLKY